MFLVDNTSKLKDVMEFKNGAYYKFVCLVRAKDYRDNPETQVLHCMEKQEILVKDWLVDSFDRLAGTLPDMLKFTELFKCRLYMVTDRKSIVKTLKTMRDGVQNYLDPFLFNPNASCSVRAVKKIASSASNMDESSDKGGRKWLFDVDTKDQEVLQEVVDYCGSSYEATFETKSGYHVVAKREFDAHRWVELEYNNVEVKENAMVLVAMAQ
jgi:hypothetical protein